MRDIHVRQATFVDLPALAALFDQYRQFQGQPSDIAAAREFLRSRFDHGESIAFLALHGDEPLGFAHVYGIYSSISLKRAFILNDLFVLRDARRSGAGAALLLAVEQHAWSFDAARVTLNVLKSNAGAQALYRAQGWELNDQYDMFNRFPPKT